MDKDKGRIYTQLQKNAMADAGMVIPENEPFVPGKHCRGEQPFINSMACYKSCFGTGGLFTISIIGNPPCVGSPATIRTETVAREKMARGIAGF